MWGPIIGAGINLAGSLLGNVFGGGSNAEGGGSKKAKHHQLDYDRRRIKAIVDGANDAGIHPLAALGAAGSGGFAAPVNNSGWGVGDAIGAGLRDASDAFGTLYESDQDRIERAEDRAYNESMQRRQNAIDNLRAKEVTPEVKLNRENMALQNDLLRMDIATSRTKLAQARAAAIGASTGSTLVGASGTFSPPPGRSTGQDFENQYGEAGDLEGYAMLADDIIKGRTTTNPFPIVGDLEKRWAEWLKSKGLWGILRGGQGKYVQPPGRGPNPNR